MRNVAYALVALNVLYCAASVFVPSLPGWKMFDAAEKLDGLAVTDRAGRPVDLHAFLPRGAYFTEEREFLAVAAWLLARRPVEYTLHAPSR